MNANEESKDLVNVIDSLILELDQLAADKSTSTAELFERACDTIRAIFPTESTAVFILGVNDQPIAATRDSQTFESFFPEGPNALKTIENASGGTVFSNQEHLVTVGFGLRHKDQLKGILTVCTKAEDYSTATESVTGAVADLLSRFISRQLDVAADEEFSELLSKFSLSCMSTLNSTELAKILTNDARILLACERTQFFEYSAGSLVLRAVSSVAIFERRTALLRCSTSLAKDVVRSRQPILFTRQPADSIIQSKLDEYRDLSGFPFFAFLPLYVNHPNGQQDPPFAVLLTEFTEEPHLLHFVRSANAVVPLMSSSLSNARKVSAIPFHQTQLFLGNALKFRSLTKLLLSVVLPLAFLLFVTVYQTDFKVRMEGSLRAVNERRVFSPHDAFVKNVVVSHGELVSEGQLLVELRSPIIEIQLEESVGEINKLRDLKSSKEIVLNQTTTGSSSDRSMQARLASEIAELDFQIGAQEDKRDYLQKQIQELTLHSPISGRVLTWDLQKLLREKPVRWGEPLLQIADESGRWELQFLVSENKIGYITGASENKKKRFA